MGIARDQVRPMVTALGSIYASDSAQGSDAAGIPLGALLQAAAAHRARVDSGPGLSLDREAAIALASVLHALLDGRDRTPPPLRWRLDRLHLRIELKAGVDEFELELARAELGTLGGQLSGNATTLWIELPLASIVAGLQRH